MILLLPGSPSTGALSHSHKPGTIVNCPGVTAWGAARWLDGFRRISTRMLPLMLSLQARERETCKMKLFHDLICHVVRYSHLTPVCLRLTVDSKLITS